MFDRRKDLNRWLIAILAALTATVAVACLSNPTSDSEDGRCPAGAEYDEQRGRCVSLGGPDAVEDTSQPEPDVTGPEDTSQPEPDAVEDTSQPEPDTAGPADADADPVEDTTPEDTGVDATIPGDCGSTSLADRFSVSTIAGSSFSGRVHAAAGPNDGAFVAYRSGGQIQVSQVRADGSVVADHTISGDGIYGLATSDDAFAMLVYRQSDILALVITDHNGTTIEDKTLIGDVDHNVQENEWFGHQIRDGRITATNDGWAAYYTVQRLWSDGVAHYGDQLRVFDADGTDAAGGWGWGCSHSMELRIAHNGQRLGPLCLSDCYPSKGVHFNHRGGKLWTDEDGSDCRGGYGTTLGASVATHDGFWLTFTATDQRDSHDVGIARVTGFSLGDTKWLTDDTTRDDNLNAAMYGDDLLVAWTAGGTNQFEIVSDPDGAPLSGPEDIPDAGLAGSSDFFQFTNGDIGWAQSSGGGEVDLARLRVCE